MCESCVGLNSLRDEALTSCFLLNGIPSSCAVYRHICKEVGWGIERPGLKTWKPIHDKRLLLLVVVVLLPLSCFTDLDLT